MADITYDKSKGSEYCTAVTDTGETVRAKLVNVVSGQIIYDKTKSSEYVTVITDTGETVRAKLVNQIS